ncbi:MAG TPA: FHA domain-containing protein [bacterium (Candidatus Stahlbacteria)]|nr:FHA domain-containing protein [Candidatus Stahlbacteria bacterium]
MTMAEIVLGKYELRDKIAAGNTGIIYYGGDVFQKKDVAIKKVFDYLVSDSDFISMLRTNVRFAGALSHDNLLNIIDYGQENNHYYIVSEYIDGNNLSQLMKAMGVLPLELAIGIVNLVCEGLEYAYENGVLVYGVLKPNNIMLTREGRVVLLDIDTFQVKQQAVSKGIISPYALYYGYLRQHRAKDIQRTDLVALALILKEMLKRDLLQLKAIKSDVKKGRATPKLSDTDMQALVEVESVLNRALSEDYSIRYREIKEFKTALLRVAPRVKNWMRIPPRFKRFLIYHIPRDISPPTEVISIKIPKPIQRNNETVILDKGEYLPEGEVPYKSLSLKWCLKPLRDEKITVKKPYTLTEGVTLIGKHRDCDLVLDDDSVSRQHATIWYEDHIYKILDLESTNGTFVNGVRIRGPIKLSYGDYIQLGRVAFSFSAYPEELSIGEEIDKSIRAIGKYEIESKITESSYWVLLSAQNKERDERVYLKILKPKFINNEELKNCFCLFPERWLKIKYPYLCRVYQVYKGKENVYVEMEHIYGKNLNDIIYEKVALPLSYALEYAEQICDLLIYLEKKGIAPYGHIHPYNIFVTTGHKIKLADIVDYGFIHIGEYLPEINDVAYSSPEQVMREPIDVRSDIYSLGVLLYEMIVGKKLFTGLSVCEIQLAHVRGEVAALISDREVIPMELYELIRKMLAKRPENRYQRLEYLLRDLKKIKA